MALFDPEKLIGYQLARQHNRAVHALIKKAKTRGYSDLVHQFRGSTVSIPANLLEGIGEWRLGKRLHYLMICKGSTWESWAHADSFVDFELIDVSEIGEVRGLQQRLSGWLISTIRSLEGQGITEELPHK